MDSVLLVIHAQIAVHMYKSEGIHDIKVAVMRTIKLVTNRAIWRDRFLFLLGVSAKGEVKCDICQSQDCKNKNTKKGTETMIQGIF